MQPDIYGEDEEDIERHAEVVRRLLPQGFVIQRLLRLLPDPKTQDLWTTYDIVQNAAGVSRAAREVVVGPAPGPVGEGRRGDVLEVQAV